jgi:subtilisin-like proprotein convertase family protein
MVNILLSFDGGFTYPLTLLENTPNDGSVDIQVPNTVGTQNRIRVQSVGNVFFDISNSDFNIVEPVVPTFSLSATPSEQTVCGSNAGVVSYEISSNGLSGFNDPVTLSANGLPNGIQASFSNNNTVPNSSSTLTLNGVENVPSGMYSFSVDGNGGGQSFTLGLELEVFDNSPEATQLLTPANVEDNVAPSPTLTWQAVTFTENYILEVSDNINFSNIIYSTTTDIPEANVQGLLGGEVYYWRVRGTNICGEGQSSETFRFRTNIEECTTYSNDIPVTISTNGTPTITSDITVSSSAPIESVSVSTTISHTYISDLDVDLISPSGDRVTLFDRPGVPATNFGCNGNNIQATFDDEATLTADDFENTCDFNVPFAIEGSYQPIDPLAEFTGDNPFGNWTFELTDNFAEDGGELVSWDLEICRSSDPIMPPIASNNLPLSVEQSGTEIISDQELLFTGSSASIDFVYTLISLPSSGSLTLNGQTLQIGSTFTQADIDNSLLSYTHNGDNATTDSFLFDTEETNAGWSTNNTFQINIIEMNFSASAEQMATISCFRGSDGLITVTLDGGQAPFMYSLDGTNFQASNVFNNLSAGEYTITITDNDNNETITNTITLTEPTEISVTPMVNESTVTLMASGGTGTLSYSLDNTNFQTENVFSNLANGDYTFYVKDENDCVVSSMIVSVLVNNLSITGNILRELSCFNGNDAIVSADVMNATPPVVFSLNGGTPQNQSVFMGLGAGDYIIEVTDGNGFMVSTNTITIQNPSELLIDVSILGNQITAIGSGGTGALQRCKRLRCHTNGNNRCRLIKCICQLDK